MTSICWKSAVTWSLLGLMFLLFILMVGPLPALAGSPDAVLYEVTEDMYLKDAAGNFVNSVETIDGRPGAAFKFTGTFRLPFSVDDGGRHHRARREVDAYYMDDNGHLTEIKDHERSLGVPTVRLDIEF